MELLLGLVVETWDSVQPHYQLMALSGALALADKASDDKVRAMLQHMRANLHHFKPKQLVELMELNMRPQSPDQEELLR